MLSSRALPRVLATLLATLLGAVLGVTLLTGPASAAPAPAGEESVRLIVRTDTKARTREVATSVRETMADQGARSAGRVRKLRAVAVDVPKSTARSIAALLQRQDGVASVTVAHQRWLTEVPGDPGFIDQRVYLDAVRATTAWGRPAHGAPDIRIAVVDSGGDVTHPDLSGKVAGTFNAITRGTDVHDVVGHGTGVASVAAASTNNGVGIAGAGYDSTLLIAKVADVAGRIFTDDLAAGVVWAVDSGADVINLSLGGPSSDDLERDAVAYAQRHGVLVVAAAGNEGTSTKQYPAALDGVLSVGATSPTGSNRAAFSSFGPWVDVAAPGRDIVVATPGGGYDTADGTSFASPLVAGQVALLAAHRPGRTPEELSEAITASTNAARLGFAGGLVDFDRSLNMLSPATAPTVSYPPSGSVVSGMANVSVASSAAQVKVQLADLTHLVPVNGGVANATVETYGLSGVQTITATDCSAVGQCASAGTSIPVTVGNAAPALTSPLTGSDASADVIAASATAAGGAVRFLLDGATAATDLAAPFSADLSTEALADGSHTVGAVSCRSDGTVCDGATSSSAQVTTTRLHPAITGTSPTVFSPGNDGRRDRTTATYRLPSRQDVTFRVRDDSGTVIQSRSLGRLAGGSHSVRWDGRAEDRTIAGSGTYTLEISTTDGPLHGLATRSVIIDRRAPKAAQVTRDLATVYPAADGYRDRVRLHGMLREGVRWIRVEATAPNGRVYVGQTRRSRAAGEVVVSWDGRSGSGAVAPSGTYRVRLASEDKAGNRARSRAVQVDVSGERLARRLGTMTVTARKSLDAALYDECSLMFRHTEGKRRGWVAYYSSGSCRSADAYAAGEHQVRLPKAAAYGTVRISAHGGRADKRYPDSARLTYFDKRQNLSDHSVRLRPRADDYRGPRVRADKLLHRKRVLRWSVMTTGVSWYDVESFTVRYTYFVLR